MTKNELQLFGSRVHSVRKARKYTQEYIAEQLSISMRFYQMVERGEKCVSLPTLIKLSRVLDVSLDYLIFGNVVEYDSRNPIISLFETLSPNQKLCAENMLREFEKACSHG